MIKQIRLILSYYLYNCKTGNKTMAKTLYKSWNYLKKKKENPWGQKSTKQNIEKIGLLFTFLLFYLSSLLTTIVFCKISTLIKSNLKGIIKTI